MLNEEDLTAKRSVFIINKNGELVYKNTAFKADAREDYEACIRQLEELI